MPVAMAYNLTMVDAEKRVLTAYVAPDRAAEFTHHRSPPIIAGRCRTASSMPSNSPASSGGTRSAELLAERPDAGEPGRRVSAATAVLDAVLARVRHRLHRAVPARGPVRAIVLAGPAMGAAFR